MEDQIISFETAKLAKEKGFNISTLNYYFEDGDLKENELTGTNGYYGEEYCFSFNKFLENWNNEWLTKKDGDRCFGCNKSNGYLETFSAPTQSLLQRWLREVHNLHIYLDTTSSFDQMETHRSKYKALIKHPFTPFRWTTGKYYLGDTYEEALEVGLYQALLLIKST